MIEEDKKKMKKEKKIRAFGKKNSDAEIEYEIDKQESMVQSGLSEEALQNQQLGSYVFGSLSVTTP